MDLRLPQRNVGVGGSQNPGLLNNLISYWKLDEASNGSVPVTRLDSVVASGNDLTDNNTTASAAGKIGSAASFISTNNESLSRASNASLQTGDITYSIALWVNLAATGAARHVFVSKGSMITGPLEYAVGYNLGTDRFEFQVNGSTVLSANSLGSPGLGVWHFIICWFENVGQTLNMQCDNGTVDTVAYAGGGLATADPIKFGADVVDRAYDGLIDEVGFWKRKLLAGDRIALWNGGAGLTYPF